MTFRIEYQTKGSDFIDFPYGSPFPIIIMMGDAGNNPERVLLKMEYSPLTTGVIPKSVKGLILPLSLFEPYGISMTCLFICDYASDIPFQQVSVDEGEKEFNFSFNSNSSSTLTQNIPWPSFFPSQQTAVAPNASPLGDPFIIQNPSPVGLTDRFIMYYFDAAGGTLKTYYKTAQSLEGTSDGAWSASFLITSLNGCHKFVLLIDSLGVPVQIGGKYIGYGSVFLGVNKVIYQYESTNLVSGWVQSASPVVTLGAPGSYDSFMADTPSALYDSGMIYLWYMGAPATPMPDTGLASVVMLAKSSLPGAGFVKNTLPVMYPSLTAGWKYGWLGGVNIKHVPGFASKYFMVYNAGNTRPATPGAEPDGSSIGYAVSNSLEGPWLDYAFNPAITSTTNTGALEKVNVWRGFLVFDSYIQKYYLYYNCSSTSVAGELVTFARDGVGAFSTPPTPYTFTSAALTTIPNISLIASAAGIYMATVSGALSVAAATTASFVTFAVYLKTASGATVAGQTIVVPKGSTAAFNLQAISGISGKTQYLLQISVPSGYEATNLTLPGANINLSLQK